VILAAVVRAYVQRRGVHATLAFARKPEAEPAVAAH